MIKVLKAGFYTSIQDKGREGYASIGVPVSGVMDTYSADLANRILNNVETVAVLEIAFGFCAFEFLSETTICISGGHFSPKINGVPISLQTRIRVYENEVLTFGHPTFGARCYLAVKNGFLTARVLKSRSFFQNITQQSLLRKGDVLPIGIFKEGTNSSNTSVKVAKSHFESQIITCYKGPEFDALETFQKEALVKQVFTISNDNSRMGYRLNELVENDLSSILTSAVLPGTVQLTPSGKLIVLMRDCQVTGGYPRVLQLTNTAINQLAQKKTNHTFQFVLK
tara:strand:- start:108 stop:953 length:846 start_codon:yes stop_codon:yes gene_type:complete